jgi:hypothetical protein
MIDEHGSVEIMSDRRRRKVATLRKICSTSTFPATNLRWTSLGLNQKQEKFSQEAHLNIVTYFGIKHRNRVVSIPVSYS